MLKKWPLSDRCSLERKNFTSSYPWAILTECYFQTMFTGYIKLRISSPFPRPRFSNKLTFQHSLDGHRLFCNFNINFEYLSIRTLQLNWRHGVRSQGDGGLEAEVSRATLSNSNTKKRRTRPLQSTFQFLKVLLGTRSWSPELLHFINLNV